MPHCSSPVRAFQSTPSAWRETSERVGSECHRVISIHSLRMEGDILDIAEAVQEDISIHSLRMEGDGLIRELSSRIDISIHSLRMEGDLDENGHMFIDRNFNPLPPHGGRLYTSFNSMLTLSFQSTPSAWRETVSAERRTAEFVISIHSLRMEGDDSINEIVESIDNFNPLPPHGGRHGDVKYTVSSLSYFNPLPPHGGRHFSLYSFMYSSSFQSTPSAWRET